MKISFVVGARPQFVKMAAFSRSMDSSPTIIHTGQHYNENMSSVFFDEMNIPKPKYNLGIGGLTQGAMTGRMIEKIEEILENERPDWLVVFGDTNSTLAGAIAASKLHIPIAHVEAGLRSYNRKMPEEINRVLTDHCSTLLFTPTKQATNTLLAEGVEQQKVKEVGDIMLDAALYYKNASNVTESEPYVLATIHRAENTDNPRRLHYIFDELIKLSKFIQVTIPLHPRTRQALDSLNMMNKCQSALHIIDPVGYIDMIRLENNAQLIVTDSGGVQKEAFFFQTPCITMRSETEWNELVKHGFNHLLDPSKNSCLLEAYREMIEKEYDWTLPLYGDGHAARKMLLHMKELSCS